MYLFLYGPICVCSCFSGYLTLCLSVHLYVCVCVCVCVFVCEKLTHSSGLALFQLSALVTLRDRSQYGGVPLCTTDVISVQSVVCLFLCLFVWLFVFLFGLF